jgi:hypothetical protein
VLASSRIRENGKMSSQTTPVLVFAVVLAGCGLSMPERSTQMSCDELESLCTIAHVALFQPDPFPSRSRRRSIEELEDEVSRERAMEQLQVCFDEAAKRCPEAHAKLLREL